MYPRGMKWETYLALEGFKDDIVHGLERQTRDVAAVQAGTTRALEQGFGTMIASQQEMKTVMRDGLGSFLRAGAGIQWR